MPESLDLLIANKEGKKALYRLELLAGSAGLTTISIYHRRVEGKDRNKLVVKSYGFCFNHDSRELVYVSVHRGDFTNPHFRWSDTRDEQFEGEDIPGTFYMQALGYLEKICDYLREEKENAATCKEKDKYERFLSPLEKMLPSDKK